MAKMYDPLPLTVGSLGGIRTVGWEDEFKAENENLHVHSAGFGTKTMGTTSNLSQTSIFPIA